MVGVLASSVIYREFQCWRVKPKI